MYSRQASCADLRHCRAVPTLWSDKGFLPLANDYVSFAGESINKTDRDNNRQRQPPMKITIKYCAQ